jgi:hypothetical protein
MVNLGRDEIPVDINNQGDIAFAGTWPHVSHPTGDATSFQDDLTPVRMNNVGQVILRRPDALAHDGYGYYFAEANAEYAALEFPRSWVLTDLNDLGQVVAGSTARAPRTHRLAARHRCGEGLRTCDRCPADQQPGATWLMSERVFCGDPCRGGYDTSY